MATESPKEKAGGLAYDVILAPASKEEPPLPTSPPKPRPLSQEIIEKKLKDAEERRQSYEAAKLGKISKTKERVEEVQKRQEELNDSFAKDSEKKLAEKLQAVELNKEEQAKALQEKFREHSKKIDMARKRVEEALRQTQERYMQEFHSKMESFKGNRDAQLKALQERLNEHELHVREVVEAKQSQVEENSRSQQEKNQQKMELMLKNRDEQFNQIMEKLLEHEKHIQEVREKKMSGAATEENGSGDN